MLDEDEWSEIEPVLSEAIQDVKRYREETGASLAEAKEIALGLSARQKYEELTGYTETNVNAIWHHRRSIYGPECHRCGKPLRTPRAKKCMECGAPRDQSGV